MFVFSRVLIPLSCSSAVENPEAPRQGDMDKVVGDDAASGRIEPLKSTDPQSKAQEATLKQTRSTPGNLASTSTGGTPLTPKMLRMLKKVVSKKSSL